MLPGLELRSLGRPAHSQSLYRPSYRGSLREHCDDVNIDGEILMDLHVFSPSEYENAIFGMPPVCHTYIDVGLA
jgi:hypothetical protein